MPASRSRGGSLSGSRLQKAPLFCFLLLALSAASACQSDPAETNDPNGSGGWMNGSGGEGGDDLCAVPPTDGHCPSPYVPIEGAKGNLELGCWGAPTTLTCSRGATGALWCVIDIRDGSVYRIEGQTCLADEHLRACTEEEFQDTFETIDEKSSCG